MTLPPPILIHTVVPIENNSLEAALASTKISFVYPTHLLCLLTSTYRASPGLQTFLPINNVDIFKYHIAY